MFVPIGTFAFFVAFFRKGEGKRWKINFVFPKQKISKEALDMKRVLILLCCLLLVVCVFASCDDETTAPTNDPQQPQQHA